MGRREKRIEEGGREKVRGGGEGRGEMKGKVQVGEEKEMSGC